MTPTPHKKTGNDRQVDGEELQEIRKLKTSAAVARAVAHDFNNILASIFSYVEILKLDLTPDHPHYQALQSILSYGTRARELTLRIAALNQIGNSHPETIRLAPIIVEQINSLQPKLPSGAQIVQDIDADCPPIFADIVQMHQMIENLFQYALFSLPPDDGRIHVTLKSVEPKKTNNRSRLRPGKQIKFSVQHNGSDVSKETLERIFEPFFQKKRNSKETGLELSLAYGVVWANKGTISAESHPETGTAFHVHFPMPSDSASKPN